MNGLDLYQDKYIINHKNDPKIKYAELTYIPNQFEYLDPQGQAKQLMLRILQEDSYFLANELIDCQPLDVIDILYGNSDELLREIISKYKILTNVELQTVLNKKYTGEVLRVINARLASLNIERIKDKYDQDRDCFELAAACKGFRSSLNIFFKIFLVSSLDRSVGVLYRFQELNEQSLDVAIKQKFDRDQVVEHSITILVEQTQERKQAKILRKALKDNRQLAIIRVLGSTNIFNILEAYQEMYDQDALKQIKMGSTGQYAKIINSLFE
ncbi:Annexin [Hexamita inflata]|uniref:Annexin n=1 Tax=Hexamita inflata TaxID=28002 RepID=A0AA86RDS3_9EUKA|nr:Annexin [Hexamita inflata]